MNSRTQGIVVVLFAATICLVLLAAVVTVGVLEVQDSGADTSATVERLDSVVQVLVGVVLGYLARGGNRVDHNGTAPTDGAVPRGQTMTETLPDPIRDPNEPTTDPTPVVDDPGHDDPSTEEGGRGSEQVHQEGENRHHEDA